MIFPLFPMLCSTILLFQFYHETLRRAMCNRKNGKSGNLITLIKLPGLPQYYVNRFTPPPWKIRYIFPRGKKSVLRELLLKTGVRKYDFFMIIWRGKGRRSPSLRAFWRSRKSPRIDKARLIISLSKIHLTFSNYWGFRCGKSWVMRNDMLSFFKTNKTAVDETE